MDLKELLSELEKRREIKKPTTLESNPLTFNNELSRRDLFALECLKIVYSPNYNIETSATDEAIEIADLLIRKLDKRK